MRDCRLIFDARSFYHDGVSNMAIDEVLLQSAVESGTTTLRFYGWNRPTLSLGYFQKLSDRALHEASRGCEIVRRASGGGAILHHHELTYCFAAPSESRFAASHFYHVFHDTLVDVLADLGVVARLHTEREGLDAKAFLCFHRRASGDVTCDRYKVAGSAQRKQKHAVAQHGSILLWRSPYAPEIPGLRDLAGLEAGWEAIVPAWLERLGPRLKVAFHAADLADKEPDRVERMREDRFAHATWTGRR